MGTNTLYLQYVSVNHINIALHIIFYGDLDKCLHLQRVQNVRYWYTTLFMKYHILTKTIQYSIHNIVHFHHRFHFRAQNECQ